MSSLSIACRELSSAVWPIRTCRSLRRSSKKARERDPVGCGVRPVECSGDGDLAVGRGEGRQVEYAVVGRDLGRATCRAREQGEAEVGEAAIALYAVGQWRVQIGTTPAALGKQVPALKL
jgi:hypothetical protein